MMATSALIERLGLEINIMSYIINYQPINVPVTAEDFKIEVIRDVFEWWQDLKYVPTRHISKLEDEIIELCSDPDYASCGYHDFLLECKMLKEMNENEEDYQRAL